MNKWKNEYAVTGASGIHLTSSSILGVPLPDGDGYCNPCVSFSANALLPLSTRICSCGCCKLMQQERSGKEMLHLIDAMPSSSRSIEQNTPWRPAPVSAQSGVLGCPGPDEEV